LFRAASNEKRGFLTGGHVMWSVERRLLFDFGIKAAQEA